MASLPRRSPLALAVLALLYEAPMHPYRMQQLIRERGKDQVINVRQRASIYQTIDRLLRDGLIAVRETERDENWPERTVYELTPAGRQLMMQWLREMLAAPARGFPRLSRRPGVHAAAGARGCRRSARGARRQPGGRADQDHRHMAAAADYLPRIVLIEDEYRIAVLRAELDWVTALIDELRDSRFSWDEEQLRELAAQAAGAASEH